MMCTTRNKIRKVLIRARYEESSGAQESSTSSHYCSPKCRILYYSVQFEYYFVDFEINNELHSKNDPERSSICIIGVQ